MSQSPEHVPRGRDPLRSLRLRLLAAIVFVEAAVLAILTVTLVIELLVDVASSVLSGLALAVLTAIGAVWLAAVGIGILRGRPWVRGATITWQILQIAVAIGAFQGTFARPEVGWLLVIPSLGALVLLFTPPVIAATTRRE